MKIAQNIFYGIVIGHWLLNVHNRLHPSNGVGRYVVVAMHSMRDDKVVVGYTSNSVKAANAADDIEEYTIGYMGITYDLTIPGDRAEFRSMKFTDDIDREDMQAFSMVRGSLCERDG